MTEQKPDRKIRAMEKEQKILAHLIGNRAGIGSQRQRTGGWR